MEQQRRLRLGDILDDYCPRERRVTNHAIVAMIEDDVKQTRCTTCDAEHVYKGGKAPRRKKSETTTALYREVLAGITDEDATPSLAVPAPSNEPAAPIAASSPIDDEEDAAPAEPFAEPDVIAQTVPDPIEDRDPEEGDEESQSGMPAPDEGPVHRPLIRAQLPRVEGVKVERQAPDFTIRQNNLRGGGSFRGGDARGQGGRHAGNGSGSGARFGGRGPQQRGGGSGRGGGAGHGFGRGPGAGNQPRHGGGNGPRKRGR
jgi:hypothetical protein